MNVYIHTYVHVHISSMGGAYVCIYVRFSFYILSMCVQLQLYVFIYIYGGIVCINLLVVKNVVIVNCSVVNDAVVFSSYRSRPSSATIHSGYSCARGLRLNCGYGVREEVSLALSKIASYAHKGVPQLYHCEEVKSKESFEY